MKNGDTGDTEEQRRRATRVILNFKSALNEHAIVAIGDQRGKITHVNGKFCLISCDEESVLVGKDQRILNSGPYSKGGFQDLRHSIQSGAVGRGKNRNRGKDGVIDWGDSTVVPFPDEQGNSEQYIAIQTDITERVLHEERLRDLASELDRRKCELKAMIHAVSHDLRSPLVNVQGFSKMIVGQMAALKGVLTEAEEGKSGAGEAGREIGVEMDRALGHILASTAKMEALLNGLLEMSRLGTAETAIRELDVESVVRSSLSAMNFQFDQAGASVVVHKLPPALADRRLLGRVCSNLFENALKYASPDRPLILEISAELERDRVIYQVKDNGIGIAREHEVRIFELFHRVNPAAGDGQGFGLAIVKGALDRMDGQVSVSSEMDVGSSFSISLPRSE